MFEGPVEEASLVLDSFSLGSVGDMRRKLRSFWENWLLGPLTCLLLKIGTPVKVRLSDFSACFSDGRCVVEEELKY